MELLPSNVPAKNIVDYSANSKGKKRASTNDTFTNDGPSTPKRVCRDFVGEPSDDINMAEVGEAGEASA